MIDIPWKLNIIAGAILPWLLSRRAYDRTGPYNLVNFSKMLLLLTGAYLALFVLQMVFMLTTSFPIIVMFRIVVAILFIAAIRKYSPLDCGRGQLFFMKPIKRKSLKYLLLILLFGYTSIAAVSAVYLRANEILNDQINIIILNAVVDKPWLSSITFIGTLLIAAASEELVFRYYALEALRTRYSKITSIVLSSIIWALMHWDMEWSIVILGLFLGYFYLETGSVWLCTFLHFMFNIFINTEIFYLSYPCVGFSIPIYGAAIFVIMFLFYHLLEKVQMPTVENPSGSL